MTAMSMVETTLEAGALILFVAAVLLFADLMSGVVS